ncbi:hypothetical protein Tco_0221251 [Tanacetum coccineum]
MQLMFILRWKLYLITKDMMLWMLTRKLISSKYNAYRKEILTNIIKNHPLRFSIAASSSVPWIYMAQFWHTLKEDGSKYRLKFMLDKKELTLTLDDFRTIFHLPQATDKYNSFFQDNWSSATMANVMQDILPKCLDNSWSCPLDGINAFADMQMKLMIVLEDKYPQFVKMMISEEYFYIQERRSIRLTHSSSANVAKAYEMILQDTLQISLAEHKSFEEQEAREIVALVDEHLASEEIEKMVDGQENVVDDSSIPRNDESNILGTRIEPRSNKESTEVEITKDKGVEITKETPVVDITNVVIPVKVNDDDDENNDEVYELMRMEKGKICEEIGIHQSRTIRSPRIHTNLRQKAKEEMEILIAKLFFHEGGNIRLNFNKKLRMKFERNNSTTNACRTPAVRPRDQDNPHDAAHPEGENSAKRQKTSEYEAYVSRESSSGQRMFDNTNEASINKTLERSIADH